MPKSIASGHISLGGEPVECHVLDDERRVLSTSQIQEFFGAAMDRKFVRSLARIVSRSDALEVRPRIRFRLKDHGFAYGYEGTFILDICLAYQAAFLANKLHHAQVTIARRAMDVVCVYAKAGIEAAIDEATGYQRIRPGDYLEQKIKRLLREARDEWKPRWQEETIAALCALYRKPYSPNPKFMQRVAGTLYDILIGPDVMAELRRRNPLPEKGTNHHQYLKQAVQTLLEKELVVITALATTTTSVRRFWNQVRARYLGEPLQLEFGDRG
jgi:hypothetical protein